MQYFYKNNHSQNLILFFSGWGCDEHQFTNLHDTNDDILILFDYQDLNLDFDFTPYKKIDLIAYSAGVFVASIFLSAYRTTSFITNLWMAELIISIVL